MDVSKNGGEKAMGFYTLCDGRASAMAVSMITIIIFTIILVPFPISHTHSVILTEIPSKNFNQLVSRDHS